MATSYYDVYCLNEAIMTDSKLSNTPDNIKYFVFSKYLDFAVSEFRKYCYQDLDDRTEFEQEIYTFVTDGSGTYPLSPAPPSGSEFYVSLNGVELEDSEYSIDTINNEITFNTPTTGSEAYVGAFVVGEFNADLNIDEKRILAEGMTVPFIEGNINLTKQLNQLMYGEGIEFYSQANHNKVNLDIKNSDYFRLHQMISLYTYVNNPDGLIGLVAKNDG